MCMCRRDKKTGGIKYGSSFLETVKTNFPILSIFFQRVQQIKLLGESKYFATTLLPEARQT